jgi:class 3 adenylate cyclase
MKIRNKLLLLLLALGFAAVGVSNYIAYVNARRDLTDASIRQLTGIRRAKALAIESYFRTIESHVKTLSMDRTFIDAMDEFRADFRKLDGPNVPPDLVRDVSDFYRTKYLPDLEKLMPKRGRLESYLPVGRAPFELQCYYTARNPNPIGQKWRLDKANDGSAYSRAHARYHPGFRRIVQTFGYEDIYLVDDESGRIVYTVNKNPDFMTSLRFGPYKDTALAAALRRTVEAKKPGEVVLTDFHPYEPAYGHPALFLVSPIFDGARRAGVLAFELSINELDRVVSGNRGWERDGLGTTGDTGIVGPDFLMRSNMRGFIQDPARHLERIRLRGGSEEQVRHIAAYGTTVLQLELRFPAIEAALGGQEGTDTNIEGGRGKLLLSYGPLDIPGLKWALASGMAESEALAPVAEMRNKLRIWTLIVLLLTAATSLLLTRAILRPVNALVGAAQKVSAGDLSAAVPVESKDELGLLSETFNGMVTSIREKTEEIALKNRENEALLLNILPAPIAVRLKEGEGRIADLFGEVTVLFADIVGFTVLSGQAEPQEVVELLNDLFTRFDARAKQHGVEKIKTIGDAYMAVTGLPSAQPDHARRMVDMALGMLDDLREYSRETGQTLSIRIGINSGPVVAGVIGKSKFIYDLWGDTVNVASRMESSGVPGAVQVTRPVYEKLKDLYEFEERGAIEVKGKGQVETWLVRRAYEESR